MNKCTLRYLLIVAILGLTVLLSGCNMQSGGNNKLKIVATTFPQYDWTRQVLGERVDEVDLVLLQDSGIDPHSFQPSTKDFMAISNADLFIYGGGASDSWAADALKNAANSDMVTFNLIEELGSQVKLVGVPDTHDHEDEDAEEHIDEAEEAHSVDDGHDHSNEIDEHIWMSLRNAGILTRSIATVLGQIDPENADEYTRNADKYIGELESLDEHFAHDIEEAPLDFVIVTDRFPFRYLFDDYDISYLAAFDGCSADAEASFETIISLANEADEHGISTFIVTESSNGKIANAVIENSNQEQHAVLALNSIQSVKRIDITGGISYLDIMHENLHVLQRALGAVSSH